MTSSERPRVYQNVARVTRELEQIISGLQKKGLTSLPSERGLTERLGCNRKTLRKALDDFDARGITRKLNRERILTGAVSEENAPQTLLLLAPTREETHDPTLTHFMNLLGHRDDLNLRALDSRGPVKETLAQVRQLIQNGLAAIFVVSNSARLRGLEEFAEDIPIIRLKADDILPETNRGSVLTDYHHGGYVGINHLLLTGRRRILVFSNTPEHSTTVFEDFEQGCSDAVQDAGVEVTLEFLRQTKDQRLDKLINAAYVRKLTGDYDAVFSYEDYLLVKLHNLLLAGGWKIPADLALLGFKDTPWSTMLHPQLSSVSTRDEALVHQALNLFLERRSDTERVKPTLVIRESTRMQAGT